MQSSHAKNATFARALELPTLPLLHNPHKPYLLPLPLLPQALHLQARRLSHVTYTRRCLVMNLKCKLQPTCRVLRASRPPPFPLPFPFPTHSIPPAPFPSPFPRCTHLRTWNPSLKSERYRSEKFARYLFRAPPEINHMQRTYSTIFCLVVVLVVDVVAVASSCALNGKSST